MTQIKNTQLTKLNKFKKASLPVLEHSLIDQDKITAVSLDMKPGSYTVFLQLQHNWDVSEPVLFPTKQLVKIAKKTDINSVSVIGDKVVISTDIGKFKATKEDLQEFPEIPRLDNTGTPVNTDNLLSIHQYASTDDLRPAMMGVSLESDKMVCTNGHVMAWKDNPANIENHIIPSAAINLLKESNHNIASAGDDFFALVGQVETVIYKPINEQYPDWEKVIPQGMPEQEATLDRVKLNKAIKGAKIGGNSHTKQLRMHFNKSLWNITIHSEDIDLSTSFKSEPVGQFSCNGDPFEIGFNAEYLKQVLKGADKEIYVKMFGPNKAVIVNEDTLLMPVMLNTYA